MPAQASYPEQPVKIVVGFSPGVAPDVTSRLLGDKFTEAWGKPVVVENVTGASGNIAVERVAKAAPDGHTLLMGGNASLVINPNLFAKLPYDPVKDFAYITQIFIVANILVVAQRRAGQEHCGIDRARQGAARLPHRRTCRHRHVAASCRRTVQDDGRRPHAAGAVPRHDRRAARPARRASQHLLRQHHEPRAADPRRQAARIRHHLAEAFAAGSRPADHGGAGLPRLRGDRVVRSDGAGRRRRSRSSTSSTRRRCACWRCPTSKAKLEGLGVQLVGNTPAEFAA